MIISKSSPQRSHQRLEGFGQWSIGVIDTVLRATSPICYSASSPPALSGDRSEPTRPQLQPRTHLDRMSLPCHSIKPVQSYDPDRREINTVSWHWCLVSILGSKHPEPSKETGIRIQCNRSNSIGVCEHNLICKT